MMHKKDAKKRLMFIQQEDYNYLIYNLIIVLLVYECNNSNSVFKDYRKIAYLIEIMGIEKKLEDFSQDELGDIYSRAQIKKVLLSHVLVILYRKEIINISMNTVHLSFDIWINEDKVLSYFKNNEMFVTEIKQLKEIKRTFSRIRTSTIKTMVDTLFTNKNIITWEI